MEKVYIGLKELSFLEGEEVEIIKGMTFDAVPIKCIIRKDYPKFIRMDVFFRKTSGGNVNELKPERRTVNKQAMLCGDVIIRLKKTQEDLVVNRVGIVGEI